MSQTPEDDRTVLSTGKLQAPGFAGDSAGASPSGSVPGDAHPSGQADAHDDGHALPAGTRLGEFEITGVLGEGGFGIVYCARDNSLERQVALKEYLPSFARRTGQAHVTVRSAQDADSFEAGLRSFINEARMLAQFDHPSLVKVYRFWEANGTAYMVMPYYRGPTLKQALKARTAPPDEAWLKALLAPLLDALEVIHGHHCYHRDIAPDNILMLEEGRPLLLDFGAARRAIGGMNQAFTVILKQNYAPIEQYAEMPGMSQGAWTDLYALASVIHFAIDGHAPPPAIGRMVTDSYVPLATRYAGRYGAAFLAAIDAALAFRPEARPQDVAAMRALLGLAPAGPQAHAPVADRAGATATAAASGSASVPQSAAPSAPSTATDAASTATAGAASGASASADPSGLARRRPLLLAGAAALLLAGGGAWLFLGRDEAVAPARQAGPAPSDASAPANQPAPAPVIGAPAASFDPVAALESVRAGADPRHQVSVGVAASRLRIGVDRFDFSVRSSVAGFVYVFIVGTKGDDFHMLFPNALDSDNRLAAGASLTLPRPGWPIRAEGPPGTDHLLVIVSESPRDFGAAGIVEGDPFSSFPLARAAQLQRAHAGAQPLFAGTPACAGQPCPDGYGAVAFSIEEVQP